MAQRNPIFAIMWLILLIFLAWPLAFAMGGIWIILQPFESVFRFVRDITSFLERFLTWPRDCGKAIVDCTSSCPQP